MKSFRINMESRVQIGMISSHSSRRGRLKKGMKRVRIGKLGLCEVEPKFYLKLANLKSHEISTFIHEYQVTLPWLDSGSNHATAEDIVQFQKDIRQILGGIKIMKKIQRVGVAFTQLYLEKQTKGLPELINKYLQDCYLALDLPPVMSKPLPEEDLTLYHQELKTFNEESSGHLRTPVFIRNKPNENFSNLACRCNSMLSWCVLDLITDMLVRHETIRGCKNCGRLFQAKNQKVEYCAEKDCQTERARKRKQESRHVETQ